MNRKKIYRCKTDLKMFREVLGLSKELVAKEIGYSVRHWERIEENNAASSEETARRICKFYKLKYEDTFDSDNNSYHILDMLKTIGTVPQNQIQPNKTYYLLYVRKLGIFKDCVLGKVGWIENCGRNKERRKLRSVYPEKVVENYPEITILNSRSEWENWYYNLIIGKWNRVMISENCLMECMRSCLNEVIVSRNELLHFDGNSDMVFLGMKKQPK